jgi:glucokinase
MTKQTLRLVADIGGTNARFALAREDGTLREPRSLGTRRFASLTEAAQEYLRAIGARPREACIAVAGPVNGDVVRLTNHRWEFSIAATRDALGLARLRVINDFEAIALALPALRADDLEQIGGGAPVPGRPMAVLGPGTGLGVAQLIATRDGFQPVSTEGGHASIGPCDEAELQILATLLRNGQQLSREALLSGPGLERIYWALCLTGNIEYQGYAAAEIQARAVAGSDATCRAALAHFCAFLGTAAGDQALCCGAQGGVYIAGGIVPRFTGFLRQSLFRARFEGKGPMRGYVSAIPVYVITRENPGMLGAARADLRS